ncbi:hypothetical protein SNARM312S_04725 [Streptomyces narbonensis]
MARSVAQEISEAGRRPGINGRSHAGPLSVPASMVGNARSASGGSSPEGNGCIPDLSGGGPETRPGPNRRSGFVDGQERPASADRAPPLATGTTRSARAAPSPRGRAFRHAGGTTMITRKGRRRETHPTPTLCLEPPVGFEPTTPALQVLDGVGWVVPGGVEPSGTARSEGLCGAARSGREPTVPVRPLTHRSRIEAGSVYVDAFTIRIAVPAWRRCRREAGWWGQILPVRSANATDRIWGS